MAEGGGGMGRWPRLVCIIGTDGSGKTTLAEALALALRARGVAAERVWLGAENRLIAPLRAVLRKVTGRRSGAGGYRGEVAVKHGLVRRHGWAVPIYLALVWWDWRMQLAVKRWRHRGAATVVADRYLFDVAVNLGLVLDWPPERVVDWVRRRLAAVALPELRVFLRVAPEVSMARKEDIPDIGYLHLRMRHYEAIAQAFGFVELDGTRPIAETCDALVAEVEWTAARLSVLYVHANNADVGGADLVLVQMARRMRDHGGGTRVAVCLRLDTHVVGAHGAGGVPVILHPFVRPQTSRGVIGVLALLLGAPGTLWFFWRLFGRERPDVVHANDLYDVLPVIAARARGIAVVWHVRMIRSDALLRRVFATALRRLAPVSVSVSRAVRDHYFTGIPLGHHRAEVVHDHGNPGLMQARGDVAVAGPRPAGLPAATGARRLVVMVGRIEPWKGQDVFVEAVARLPGDLRAGHDFVLVGGPVGGKEAYHAAVLAAARGAGILCTGARGDVPAILGAADVAVHASVAPDPFPGVVVEAMLAGAAVVASAEGGPVEMIRHGVDGCLVASRDPDALAAVLVDLLGGALPPRERFGAAGRARALDLVEPAGIDARLAAIYRDLVGTRGREGMRG